MKRVSRALCALGMMSAMILPVFAEGEGVNIGIFGYLGDLSTWIMAFVLVVAGFIFQKFDKRK